MKIHVLVQKTGLTAPTIRYYEKEGILDRRYVHRGVNNYRDYEEDIVGELLMVKMLQAAGFTLAELKELNQAVGGESLRVNRKIAFLRHKMKEIERKRRELEQVQSLLEDRLATKISLLETLNNRGAE
ncbi:MerR family transcriptional regulator [Paenibacillus sp. sgz5001063]|uniref:MerR family transcriptional regulator n=1 Tax=Paenibacillus sp. sgz5001063 TaxID=3242474 RepID=UPI0036D4017D